MIHHSKKKSNLPRALLLAGAITFASQNARVDTPYTYVHPIPTRLAITECSLLEELAQEAPRLAGRL